LFQGKNIVHKLTSFLLFFVLLLIAVGFQHRYLEKIRKWRPYRDSLYLPRGEYVKLISLGYDMVMADFLWLRAIQAFGGHFMSDKDYSNVINLFNVITDLNPYFVDAYLFGDTVVGEESGDFRKGLALIDKGIIKTLRRTYRLGYWGGYDCVWNLKDYLRAKYYYRMALKCPDCPDYVDRLLAHVDEEMGNFHIAFEKRIEDYLRAIDNNDDILKSIAERKVKDVIQKWHIAILTSAATKYKEEFSKDITSLSQLIESGVLGTYSAPRYDRFWEKVASLQEQQKQLLPHFQEIVKSTMDTFTNEIPPEPLGTFYFVVHGQTSEDDYFISTGVEARERTKRFLVGIRNLLTQYKEEHGTYPAQLKDLFKTGEWSGLDLFGEPWVYNPETGDLKSSRFPDL